MSYNENEVTRLQELKDKGYTREQAVSNVLGLRYKLGSSINMEEKAKQADDENQAKQGLGIWGVLKDMPSDIYEAGEGIVGAFKKVGETYKKNTEMINNGELTDSASIALGDLGALGSLVGGVVDEVVIGAGKLLTPDQWEKAIVKKIGALGKDVMDTDAIQRMVGMYDQLDPNAKVALNGVLGIAHGVTSVTGAGETIGLAKSGAKKAVELGGELLSRGRKLGGMVDDGLGGLKKAGTAVDDVVDVTSVEKRMAQKQLVSEGKEVTDDAINEIVTSQKSGPVKVEMFDRLAKLDSKTLQAIKADPDLAEEFLVATLRANESKDARGILAYGGDIMRGYAKDVRTMLNDTGSQIGSWRKANANKVFKVDEMDASFNNKLSDLKLAVYEVDDGSGNLVRSVNPIEGKVPEVKATDIKALNEMYKSFQILKDNPTLENIYSFRNNVDEIANFSKTEVSKPLQKFARELRHDVAETAAKQLPEEQAMLMRDYSNLSGALNDIDELVGKKAGAEYMLRALASGRESVADDALAAIKKYTGNDVKNDALIIKYLMNNVASESQLTSMEQVISSATLRNVRDMATPTGLVDKLLDAGVSKFSNPERRFKKAIEGARGTKVNPLESPKGKAPDVNVGGENKVDLDDIKSAVKQKVKLATEVKKELDDHAVKIANNYSDASLVEGPIKTPERIIQKINSDPSYQLDDVKDIVRNTIMTEKNQSSIYDELKNLKGFVREKIQTADKFHGYEGAIFNVKLSNGTVGEIQVVTPKMIYGKMEPEVSRELLGETVFNRIKKETGIEPGMGHKLYEQIQKAHFERGVDSPEAQDLIRQSVDYYKKLK
jgi:hypothetical protein